MKSERFNRILEETLDKCKKTLGVKSDEYATENRLHNFKVAAELQGCTPMTALAGMMAKHTVSVYDLIQKAERGEAVSQEMWDEKIGDHINYLLLLSAMVQEEIDFRKMIKRCGTKKKEKPFVMNDMYHCPTCKQHETLLPGDKFCVKCGQELDWSEAL